MILDYHVIHLAIHQDFSHHTVKGYFYVAQAFLDFHQETKGNMNQAVQEFLKNSIYERGNLNSTLNYKKAALKKFIRFLQKFDEEQFDYNFSRLRRSTYERLPQILFDSDIERIRLLIRNSDQFKLLDKLIICFALNHGAIPSELQQIKFSDVDLLGQTITSTTDGQQRFIFLTETDIRYLDDYLASIDDYNLDYFLLSNSIIT